MQWQHESGATVPSVVAWDAADPLTIHITFTDKNGTNTWLIGRDLLSVALNNAPGRWEGLGDIRVALLPSGLLSLLLLAGSDSSAMLSTDAGPFRAFLPYTYQEVPDSSVWTEKEDAELAGLFSRD